MGIRQTSKLFQLKLDVQSLELFNLYNHNNERSLSSDVPTKTGRILVIGFILADVSLVPGRTRPRVQFLNPPSPSEVPHKYHTLHKVSREEIKIFPRVQLDKNSTKDII